MKEGELAASQPTRGNKSFGDASQNAYKMLFRTALCRLQMFCGFFFFFKY